MSLEGVRDRWKQNVEALRHNVALSLNTRGGVPAVYQVPQGPLRAALQTAIKAACHPTPQSVFDDAYRQLDDTERSIDDIFDALEGTRRESIRFIDGIRRCLPPTIAVDPSCLVGEAAVATPTPSSSVPKGDAGEGAVGSPTPALQGAPSPPSHVAAGPIPPQTGATGSLFATLDRNVQSLTTANDQLTVALAQLCRVTEVLGAHGQGRTAGIKEQGAQL